MRAVLDHLKARLAERSSWAAIGAAIIPASMLPWPWSGLSIAVAVICVLLPDGPVLPKE